MRIWKTKEDLEEKLFNAFAIIAATVFAAVCILPVLLTISGSFTDERELFRGISLIPREFSAAAYGMILKNPASMLRAYKVTIIIVAVGTVLSLFLTSMTSYVLYRKDFAYRNVFSFYYFFTKNFIHYHFYLISNS